MWDGYGGYQAYQNQVLLATGGHDYGPQFGPALPRDYYDEEYEPDEEFDPREVPKDWDDFQGINPGEER